MRTLQTDREIAQAITSATLTDGGATYLLASRENGHAGFLTNPDVPTFVVGRSHGVPALEVPVQGFGSSDVHARLILARNAHADGVGTWTHDGVVYVDLVDLFSDREAALAAAQDRGELAIWSAHESEEILTGIAA